MTPPVRKLEKHPLDVESYNPKTGLRLKIYYRELIRERVMFIGIGVLIGSILDLWAFLFTGVDFRIVVVPLIVVSAFGAIVALTHIGANPYGDL